MTRLLAYLALAVLIGFLGILAVEAFSIDLMAVIALTIGLAGYDIITTTRRRAD